MRVYLDQIGCRLNYSEMETLARRLQAAGHQTVAGPEEAQVIVFNTCAVTNEAGRTSRQRIRRLHRTNPAARIVATGCWTTLDPTRAAQLPGVEMVAGNDRKELLHTLLEPWSSELDDPDALARMAPDGTPFSALPQPGAAQDDVGQNSAVGRVERTRAFLKVQDGCDNRCTFCVVTLARGHGRSRPLADVVDEVQHLAAEGVQEAVLTGVHLGSYGRDLADSPSDLKELTEALLTHTDIPRLRLSSLEPWELAGGFFDLWACWPERLCPHLHLPLQAGTDKQLRHMARRCTTASFRQLVAQAREAIPDLVVTTDLIVGFPGETEADFEEGLAYVASLDFAHAHIFPYSPRQGTAAAGFSGQVSKAVKKERSQRLHAVIEETGRAVRSRFVGTVRPVLWEQAQGDLTDAPGIAGSARLWSGFTDNYLRVTAALPQDIDVQNRILPARLTELHADTLFGDILLENSTLSSLGVGNNE